MAIGVEHNGMWQYAYRQFTKIEVTSAILFRGMGGMAVLTPWFQSEKFGFYSIAGIKKASTSKMSLAFHRYFTVNKRYLRYNSNTRWCKVRLGWIKLLARWKR